MNKILVQKETVDEFPIAYQLEGDFTSHNLIVMVHGGGMDHRERGMYVGLTNGQKQKYVDKNGKERTKLYSMHIGNYDRLVGEILAKELDTMILRIDLRNHGESKLENNNMDTRDMLVTRFTRDISDVIDMIIDQYSIENIHMVGTCLGGLISQCYALEIGANENSPMKNREKIASLVLDCPLSFLNLYTEDKTDSFNYEKCQKILNGPAGTQFNKMPGVYEGKQTILEAKQIGDISNYIGILNIPVFYLYGEHDRLLSMNCAEAIVNNMLLKNPDKIIVYKMCDQDHGMSDHCMYDPQSSDTLIFQFSNFLEEQVSKKAYLR